MKKWNLLLIIFVNTIAIAQNVGISTSNPTSKLQIHSTATFGRPTLRLVDSSAASGPILEFRNSGGGNYFQMAAAINNTDITQSFFSIYNNAGGSALTIKGNNNIGLGTLDPQYKLQVHNDGSDPTGNSFAHFTNNTTGNSASDGVLVGVNALGNGYLGNLETGGYLGFFTEGLTRLSIAPNGNVGINYFGALTPLHVKAWSSDGEIARFQGTNPYISLYDGTNYKGYLWHPGNRIILGTSTAEPVVISANYNEMAYFTPSGNLGINTPTPTERLDVNGNMNLTGLLKMNGSAGTAGQVLTSTGTSAPEWRAAAVANNTRFALTSQNTTGSGTYNLTTRYNLNTADVVISGNTITINKTGLYHFQLRTSCTMQFSTVQTKMPMFFFWIRVGTTDYTTGATQLLPGYGTMQDYTSSCDQGIDLHLVSGSIISLYLFAAANSTAVSVYSEGWMTGYLISE